MMNNEFIFSKYPVRYYIINIWKTFTRHNCQVTWTATTQLNYTVGYLKLKKLIIPLKITYKSVQHLKLKIHLFAVTLQ